MNGQAIFADYSSENPKQDNRVTYCDMLDDDKYVAQFLTPDDLNLNCSAQFADEPMVEMLAFEPEKVEVQSQEIHLEQGKQKKRSSFHNFQKHLVTTIRCIIDSSRLAKDPETAQCEKKIWRIFMNSSKINKTLVTVVVGDLNLEAPTRISEYGFKDIMREFKPAQIKQAQQNINEEVLKQLLAADVEKQLTNRRMRNKKQFVVYFQAFLEELMHGELEKRMAKCTKLLRNESP